MPILRSGLRIWFHQAGAKARVIPARRAGEFRTPRQGEDLLSSPDVTAVTRVRFFLFEASFRADFIFKQDSGIVGQAAC